VTVPKDRHAGYTQSGRQRYNWLTIARVLITLLP